MIFCKKCVMPDTRPGLTMDTTGVCSACRAEENKAKIDWHTRHEELKALCDKHRNCNGIDGYDCVIAVSGGKDSHYQVHMLKNEMKMNPLLVTVQDHYTKTSAGKNNLRNISEVFGCNVFAVLPDLRIDRILAWDCFKAFGRPSWLLDKLIYTAPLKVALSMNISLVVYGENVSYTYGGENAQDVPSALEQINNGVAADISFEEVAALTKGAVTPRDLNYISYPKELIEERLEPIYLSYFTPWNSYKNYLYASSVGFQTIHEEWVRENCFCDYEQIDSIGYLCNSLLKYAKFGHGLTTDYASRLVRYGILKRYEAVTLVKKYDHRIDQRCVNDFCAHVHKHPKEFFDVFQRFYDRNIFEKNDFGGWILKTPVWKEASK